MTFDNLTKGLAILAKYDPEGMKTKFMGLAYNDKVIYVAPSDIGRRKGHPGITNLDKNLLNVLGFSWNTTGWYINGD